MFGLILLMLLLCGASFYLGFYIKGILVSVLVNEASKGDAESIAIMEKYRRVGAKLEKKLS